MVARKFRPSLIPWLAVAALLPGLVWLGMWQYQRYEERLAEHQRFDDAPQTYADLATIDVDGTADFVWVAARGQYDSQHQFLIDNMVRQSRNGFFVISPFQLNDGGWILVNRGWVAQDPARKILPEIDVVEKPVTVQGRLGKLPAGGLKLASPLPNPDEWPSIRQFPTLDELSDALAVGLMSKIILLDARSDYGYVREWQPGGLPPARHLGYAVQWFALAITLLTIALVLSFRKTSDE